MNKFIVFVVLFVIVFGCNTISKSTKKVKYQISDTLMHVVSIDSSNWSIIKDFFDGVGFKECDLSLTQLKEIEKVIYLKISKDTLWNKKEIFTNFNNFERQYIYIEYKSKLCLYIKYVLLLKNNKYYKLESMWNTHLGFIKNSSKSNYSIIYNLEQKTIINITEINP